MTIAGIYILWLRQIKRYFRSKSRLIGSLGQPILFLFALGFGFNPIYQKASGGNYIQFLSPGIICMTILFSSIFTGIEVIWDRQFGFLKETLVAPISRFQIVIGRTLGGATTSVFQGIIVFIISLLAGFRPENIFMLPIALVFMILTSLLFTSIGTAIASFLEDIHGFQLIMNFLVMPLFFLSGALFPISELPKIIKFVTLLDPLTYCVDGLRAVLTGNNMFSIYTNLVIVSIMTLISLGIGAYAFSKIQI